MARWTIKFTFNFPTSQVGKNDTCETANIKLKLKHGKRINN